MLKLRVPVFFLVLIFVLNGLLYALEGPVITAIEITEGPHAVTIQVKADRKTHFHAVRAPNLIQIDVPGGNFAEAGKKVPVYAQKVKLYSTEILENEELLRIKILLFEPVPYEINHRDTELNVVVNNISTDIREFEESLRSERQSAMEAEENRARAVELYRQGSELLRDKSYNRAIPLLERALTYLPGDPDISTALEVARESLLVKEQYRREFRLAEDAFSSGNFQRAIGEFSEFLERYPDNDDGLYYLGRSYYETGDYDRAAGTLRRLIRINPRYTNINTAEEYLRLSERARADSSMARVDVKASNELMTDVVRSMLFGTGLRLEIRDNITRLVSVDLQQATLEDALNRVVTAHGAEWERRGDVIELRRGQDISEMVKSMHFQDMPLGEILDIMSTMMSVNLIINEEVDVNRPVTFFVKNHEITIHELFDLLLITNDLVKREYNRNTFFIVEREKAKLFAYEQRHQKIYNLNNVEPEEVLAVLNSVHAYRELINFSNLVVINLDEESNVIANESRWIHSTKYPTDLIHTITDNVARLSELRDADGNPLTVIESPDDLLRLIEREMTLPVRQRTLLPTWGNLSDSMVDSSTLSDLKQGQVSEMLEYYNRELATLLKSRRKVKAILVYDTAAAHEIIQKVIDEIDQKRRQVLVSMKVMEINTQVRDQLGLEWSFDGNQSSLDVRKLGDLTGVDINSTFNFLATKNLAREVASPTIRVLDGHQADTEVVTTRWVQSLERVEGTQMQGAGDTAREVSIVEYRNIPKQEDFGLKLTVSPTVHRDRQVTLNVDITQNVDAGERTLKYNSGLQMLEVDFTEIKSRNTRTIVRLRDGETAIMGGLIQNQRNNAERHVPLAGRLPLIGRMFRNNNEEVVTSEMIILITPYIVNEDDQRQVPVAENLDTQRLDYAATIARLKSRLAE